MMILPLVANADIVEINGIYYNIITKGNIAEVTSNPNTYTGNVIIPETVDYNNVTYRVTSIGDNAFESCHELTSVTIGNSVTSIGDNAFSDCPLLTSFTIPDNVTSIGARVFQYCFGLTDVTIGNSVTSIGDYDFYSCYRMTSITIGNSVTSIGDRAFGYCTALNSVSIPDSMTSIGTSAFYYCNGLISITIPNSVTLIGPYAFDSCSGLTSVTIGNGVTSIYERTFSGCTKLTDITIPNSVTTIELSAFSSCQGLTFVTIPNSVKSIGNDAFYGCTGLTYITIGSGIKTIGSFAFGACPNLIDVTCYAENAPRTSSDAFEDSYIEYTTLHVPSASVNVYKAAEPWKNFKSIEAIPKCEKPTIGYENGKLTFASSTEGATYQYTITDDDIKAGSGNEVQLAVTYNISVYATKEGYDNSETATATLCWIDAAPQTEGITDGMAQIAARPVLVKTDNGFITVEGVDDKTNVSIYTTDGKQLGSAISKNNVATIATNIQPGSIAIVKVGDKAIRVIMK